MHEKNCSAVGLFCDHRDAEEAVMELQKAGFDMKKLSVVGKDYQTEESVIGYYNTGERMATWGKFGLFWGSIWGLLFGSAFLIIPGLGPVMIGGPLVSWILGALKPPCSGRPHRAGRRAFRYRNPRDSVIHYETALKANKFLLVVPGSAAEIAAAKEILLRNKAEEAHIHETPSDPQPLAA